MQLAEPAQEGVVGDEPEPSPADSGGMDEAGGKANTDDDLREKVVVVEHIGHTRRWQLRLVQLSYHGLEEDRPSCRSTK